MFTLHVSAYMAIFMACYVDSFTFFTLPKIILLFLRELLRNFEGNVAFCEALTFPSDMQFQYVASWKPCSAPFITIHIEGNINIFHSVL
jgi:hypothetical protein